MDRKRLKLAPLNATSRINEPLQATVLQGAPEPIDYWWFKYQPIPGSPYQAPKQIATGQTFTPTEPGTYFGRAQHTIPEYQPGDEYQDPIPNQRKYLGNDQWSSSTVRGNDTTTTGSTLVS